jgi:histidinol-phosphate/aromatic aminotransferase/cobyric acid decarboxylase-like protein
MITARPDILATGLAAHGGRRARHDGSDVQYDFSVCLNAYGAAPIVRDAVHTAPTDEYPDPHAVTPRSAAAERWDRPMSEILFTAGAAESIHLTCFTYVRPGDPVLIVAPAFGEYERAVRLCGGRPSRVDAMTTRGTDTDVVTAVCDALLRMRPRLAFVCAPSNPTGRCLTRDELAAIADACAGQGTLLILDQAYDAFMASPLGTPALPGHPAVLHLRSITKDHALAGVRASFAVGPAEVIEALASAQIPWTASSAAHAAAAAAMSDEAQAHVSRTTALLRAEASRVAGVIGDIGYAVRSSTTHFFLIHVGHAADCRDALVQREHLLVRDCTSFGLPAWIRIAARTPAENDVLIGALARWCTEAGPASASSLSHSAHA